MNHVDQYLSPLRSEVIESQRAQTDFIKWKLIIVSALGSVSLGVAKTNIVPGSQYLICLIPLVCAYVDLMYYHLTLRILVIGSFIRDINRANNMVSSVMAPYEQYVQETRSHKWQDCFAFEQWTVQGSSYILAFLVIILGFVFAFSGDEIGQNEKRMNVFFVFFLSGIIGLFITFFVVRMFRHKQSLIAEIGSRSA